MIKKLLRNIFVGILALTAGIFLIDGVKFIPELDVYNQAKVLLLAGSLLGIINTILLPHCKFHIITNTNNNFGNIQHNNSHLNGFYC